ncbi:hypothetical protein CC85DRAFT_272440 [Cutaneotrichosporon oleaginosum]|uniref:Phosphoglycerate mutase-like protein n=1 Tax=Cutaneotrichosporon oleaginosum TaxID=879819 RepID=A0A0J0XQW5_9TREE|nr:uncharacterized protein CC85DRAFT_272440 [Cutaneotrichosporon oleaginosum]KLT43472.1 hypothetical protein CC85DRAFT_272440 [Cutaneotrichosporon oleaginosum]TXT05623.1 hypothetical protein COLE_06943 [Cutaneotrichosporon oleaginosum]
MKFSLVLALAAAAAVFASPTPSATPNRIVFIRHAEKGCATLPGDETCGEMPRPPGGGWPPRGPPGPPGTPRKFPNGLSADGKRRAEYLRTFFGNASEFDFGYVFAAPREPELKHGERTYATVAPLASDLGVDVDISCATAPDAGACLAAAVARVAPSRDVLVCWKHRELHLIAAAMGARNAHTHYPDERNDVVWIMEGDITDKRSMHMPGLDDGRVDEGDPDLVVEPVDNAWPGWVCRLLAYVLY